MLKKINFLLEYFHCLLFYEKKVFNLKINYILFLIKNTNIFYLFLFYLDRENFNPFKSKEFKKFIKLNKKKWINKVNKNQTSKTIIVENFINHPSYTITNAISALYLNEYYKFKLKGILRTGDIKGEIIFKSYGIKNIIFLKNSNFFERLIYLYKALNITSEIKSINKFCKINFKNINVGLSTYDTYIRYTGISSLEEPNKELKILLSECLYMNDQIEKTFNKEIKISVQSETAFNPLNIYFQNCLKRKIEVFARCGEDEISLRRYTHWNQRYDYRYNISQNFFDEVYKLNKKKLLRLFKKIYLSNNKNNSFGIDARIKEYTNRNSNVISKKDLIKKFMWNKNKIAVFFLNHYIDRNFHNGPRVNFKDNYTWTDFILKLIPKIKNINWIIKPHPTEFFYNSKKNHKKVIENLVNNFNNIKLFPTHYKSSSLLKIADVALTSHGTAGIEYPAFKIRSIFADNSSYSNLKFMKMQKTKKQLINSLKNLNTNKKLNSEYIDKCRVFLVLQKNLILSKCLLIPKHIISRNINEDLFWLNCKNCLKNFKIENDIFFKMLGKQLKLKLRHTVNFNNIKITQKIYNDFDNYK